MRSCCGKRVGFGDTPLATSGGQAGELLLDIQKLCLLRLIDTEASRFGRPNPMLAKSRRHEQAIKDGRPKAVLA